MKSVEITFPGVIDFFTKGTISDYTIRRDYLDVYDKIEIAASKKLTENKVEIKPVLEAGLFFFKELNLEGYTLCTNISKGIPDGYNLIRDDIIKASTIEALNYITGVNLSGNEIKDLCKKLSNSTASMLNTYNCVLDKDGNLLHNTNNLDIHYVAIKLPDIYNQEELIKFFMKDESIVIDPKDIGNYKELIDIKNILQENNANEISINGFSNIIVASFSNPHDRFKVASMLEDHEARKFGAGHGYKLLRICR